MRFRFVVSLVVLSVVLSNFSARSEAETDPDGKNLKGVRVALDPGHLGGQWARLERRLMRFKGGSFTLKEGDMAYTIASKVKLDLESLGAKILITRGPENSSLSVSFDQWLADSNKLMIGYKKILDANPKLKEDAKLQLEMSKVSQSDHPDPEDYPMLFRKVYSKLDLLNRAELINHFEPDLAFVIHLNAENYLDGENDPVQINYNLGFVWDSGLGNYQKSIQLCEILVKSLVATTGVLPRASTLYQALFKRWVTYAGGSFFGQFFTSTTTGVFNRDLLLTRKLTVPYCYGESLFQDNEKEAVNLAAPDGWRLDQIAKAYVDATIQFVKGSQ